MPRPHHRLNLYAVPADPERVPADPREGSAWREMVDGGLILPGGEAGPAADLLIPGGFSRVRMDRPGKRTVFGNRTGGFSVKCPTCDSGLGQALSESITRWREGKDCDVECGSCGGAQSLFDVETRPRIALGSFALEWRDVQSPELTSLGESRVRELLGGEYRLVLSRG